MNLNALRFGHFADAFSSAQGRGDEPNFSELRPISLAENLLKYMRSLMDMSVAGNDTLNLWLWQGHLHNEVFRGFFHPRLYVISLV